MEFSNHLRLASKEHWREALLWFIYAVFVGLIPTWGSAAIFALFGTWPGVDFFWSHGEFYIYSAAILSPTIYVLQKTFQVNTPTAICFVLIILCTLSFAGIVAMERLNGGVAVDKGFLGWSSVVLLVVSMLFAFITRVLEQVKERPDLQHGSRGNINKLSDELDEME